MSFNHELFGKPELLILLREAQSGIEKLPASPHQSKLSSLVGDACFALQQLQANGDHFWPQPVSGVITATQAEEIKDYYHWLCKRKIDRWERLRNEDMVINEKACAVSGFAVLCDALATAMGQKELDDE